MKAKLLVFFLSMAFSALSMAAPECLKIQNYDDSSGQKQSTIESEYSAQEDPHMDLMGCFQNVAQNGIQLKPASEECSCKTALKKLCKFSKKKGNFQGSGFDEAACMTFRPLMWPKMTF
jgi:hypothetical protein